MNLKHLVSLEGSIEHQEPLYDPYYYILLDPLLLAPTGRSESQKVKHLSVLEWSKSAIMWSKGYPFSDTAVTKADLSHRYSRVKGCLIANDSYHNHLF